MKLLLMILSRFFRPIVGLILLLSVAYLIFDLLRSGTDTVAMEKWLQKTGDAELLRLYQETKDAKARKALGVSLRVYEKRYGKGAWLSHFHDDSKWGVCYADIAKIALGLTDARERDAFLDAHADAYDACVQAGELDTAYRYATLLSELKEKGGKNWHVVSQNPFAASVYDQVGANPELWNWYLDNVTWCDKFLVTCSPNDGASLKDVIMELKAQKRLYQAFANEMENKTEDEKRDLVDGDEDCDMDDAVYALGLGFMSRYGNILSSLVVAGVPVIESMAVVANSLDAFDYETPEGQRAAGEYLAWLYRNHPILWQNAADDTGAHVVWLSRQVPIQWAEQIVGRFGQEHLATFLYDNYRDDNDPRLLSVAAETIYKCQEPGWATLQKYRHEVKFKEFLLDKRIGYRVVPYILRFGEEKAFTDMWNDARWVDECFDKDGNLKRKDVSWYEMSPVGGDLGTVLKKWCQGRPCSTEEIGWAAFDTVDMVVMAFSLGMSKAATSTAKAGGKAAAKRIGRQTEKKLLKNQMRRIEQQSVKRMVAGELVNAERSLAGTLAKNAGKHASRRGWSVFKRMTRFFKGAVSNVGKGAKGVGKSVARTWRGLKKVPHATWQKVYRASRGLMWIRYGVHTIRDKGPDFVVGVADDAGKLLGKMFNSMMTAGGELIKSAVREALGGGVRGETLIGRIIQGFIAAVLLLLAVAVLIPKKAVTVLIPKESGQGN